jgi:hypothetical protein
VAESTVRLFVVREKHCWMTADSADKSKRTGCQGKQNSMQFGQENRERETKFMPTLLNSSVRLRHVEKNKNSSLSVGWWIPAEIM